MTKQQVIENVRATFPQETFGKTDEEVIQFAQNNTEKTVDTFGIIMARWTARLESARNYYGHIAEVESEDSVIELMEKDFKAYFEIAGGEDLLSFFKAFQEVVAIADKIFNS